MSYVSEHRPEQGIIIVKHQGRTLYYEALNALIEAARLTKEHASKRVLVDLLEAAPILSVVELHFLAVRLRDLNIPPGCRFAFVWAGAGSNRRAARFYRLLSRHLDHPSAAFDDLESAEAWLLSGQESA
jgi:hypothetical protein